MAQNNVSMSIPIVLHKQLMEELRQERDEARELLRSLLVFFPAMSGPALEIAALLFDADAPGACQDGDTMRG